MGKLKKKSPAKQEEGQQKISSFFQKGHIKPVSNALFTTMGSCKSMNTGSSKLTLRKPANGKTRYTETKEKEKDCSNQKVDDSTVVGTQAGHTKPEPCIIPETQGFKSPSNPRFGDTSISDNLNDSIIIPGTPQEMDKEDRTKGKKCFTRSFLTTASSVTQRPGKHAAKEHLKKMSQARKGLLSVSVKFDQTSNSVTDKKQVLPCGIDTNDQDKLDLREEDSVKQGENILQASVLNVEDTAAHQCSVKSAESSVLTESEKHGTAHQDDDPAVSHGYNRSVTSMPDDKGKLTEEKENLDLGKATPTKVYNGKCIKRMSKTGTSPDSKRSLSTDCYSDDVQHEVSRSDSSEFELLFDEDEKREIEDRKSKVVDDVEGVRRSLKEFEKKTRKTKIKPNADAVNNYQLTMNRPNVRKTVVETEDDELLNELLGEMDTSSKLKSVEKNPSLMCWRKSMNETKCVDVMKTNIPTGMTEDEKKYFESLDIEIHNEITHPEKNTTNSGHPTIFPTKPVILKKSFKNKSPKFSKTSLSSCDSTSMIKRNVCEYQDGTRRHMDNRDSTEIYDTVTQITADDKGAVKPSQNIADFPSQKGCKLTGSAGADIEEFQSQMEADLLADSFTMSPTKSTDADSTGVCIAAPCVNFGRHVVMAVNNLQDHRLELLLKDYQGGGRRTCILGGFWSDSHVFEGDIVHILASFDENGVCYITDTEGLIILNPDLLLSGTTVVSSVFCMRKSVLNEKFKGIDKGNIQMLYGSIIHQVFQQVLRKKIFEEDKILLEAEDTVKQVKFLHDMFGSNVTESDVTEEIKKYIPPLQKWLQQYTTIGKDILGAQRRADNDIAILKVKDIEENIWSPRYGVKGKIDLTVEVKIRKKNTIEHRTVPLELKTGRPTFSMEHKGQVTLYSMMSSDRREDPGQGLLLYLKEPDMKIIPADHLNKRGLIQLRNEMAYYLSRQVLKTCETDSNSYTLGRLPEPINNSRACSKCPQLLNCTLYQKAIEQRDHPSSHTMATLVPQTLTHLTEEHLGYFTHWCLLLDLEMKRGLGSGGLKDIWCKSGKEREDVGEAVSGLRLDGSQAGVGDSEQIFVKFCREKSLSSSGLGKHDYVIVSCENTSLIAVCMGTITDITDKDIVLLTERETLPRLQELKNGIYRMDKYDGYNTSAILYCNLSNILRDQPNCCRLRELIIQRRKPEFVNKMSKGEIEKVKSVFKPLNKPQKTAILKVLMAKDYVLIKGYPGTGKTSTIVSLVQVLVTLGKSVLLTSYTHSAVDNILLKLKKVGVSFLRLGKVSKVHSDIKPYTAERQTQGLSSVGELRAFYNSQNVVATSSLGINHPLFTHRRFDVCIIDEASQILQPASIGPLFNADKFVLVGDPKQLPPVIQSKEARDLGMDESLFVRLDTGMATFELNLQYRMNKDIMYLSNNLVYDGALKCGSDTVANSRLMFPDSLCVSKVLDGSPWLTPVLARESYKAAVFLNTEHISAYEDRDHKGLIKNVTESRLVSSITQVFVKCGIQQNDIGVIAPYRHQVSLIKSDLCNFPEVEVNTVDQYQGRDKDVIIISFTRSFSKSNESENKSGQLLKDVRRLNVAITRAKKKLLLIGDVRTLKQYGPLKQIIDMMKHLQAIYHMPESATVRV